MKLATKAPEKNKRKSPDAQAPTNADRLNLDGRQKRSKQPNEKESNAPEAPIDPRTLTMPVNQLVLFTRQMSMLLTSGSGIVPAINAIAPQMRAPKHRRMLEGIRNDLEEGVTLTDALSRYPRAFDASYCAVVAAGESSAQLPAMFSRLAVILGKRRAMRNRIVGSLVYPALLIVMSIKILAVMIFFVVPRFAGMFDTLGVEIPASTKILVAVANTCKSYWYVFILLFVGVIGALIYVLRSKAGQQFMSNIQIRIPIVGRLMSRLIQAQTFRILGMLLEARVGLLEGLDLARRVTRNDRFQLLYNEMRDAVTRGESVSGAMNVGVTINPSIVQAVRTGEQSGRLGDAISYVADVLDEENSEMLNATTKLIEPLVLIIMGVVVGFVAISLFMPLFDMTSAV